MIILLAKLPFTLHCLTGCRVRKWGQKLQKSSAWPSSYDLGVEEPGRGGRHSSWLLISQKFIILICICLEKFCLHSLWNYNCEWWLLVAKTACVSTKPRAKCLVDHLFTCKHLRQLSPDIINILPMLSIISSFIEVSKPIAVQYKEKKALCGHTR